MEIEEQKKIWEAEHAKPAVLHQMDSREASSGVVKFVEWLRAHGFETAGLQGVEMGCGKGRNGMYLAEQGIAMQSFDFSQNAIAEAKRRQAEAGITGVEFIVQDATQPWPFLDNTFDIALDVFASTDIPSDEGRTFARAEFLRVLKPGGFLLLYLLSADDAYHLEMIQQNPVTGQLHAFIHPENGKFEKAWDHDELLGLYRDFEVVEDQRVEKIATFHGVHYPSKYFWIVLKKH